MKTLFSLLVLVLVTGCVSTPDEKIVQVVETKYLAGAPVTHPERPKAIMEYKGTPDITIVTPGTLHDVYVEYINSNKNIDNETKKVLIANMEIITSMAVDSKPFTYIGLSKDEYFKMSTLLEDSKRWIKNANANFDYYESLELQVIPKEQ